MSDRGEAGRAIEELADRIYAIADILSLLEDLDEHDHIIKARSIAQAGRMIGQDILQITAILDDHLFTE